ELASSLEEKARRVYLAWSVMPTTAVPAAATPAEANADRGPVKGRVIRVISRIIGIGIRRGVAIGIRRTCISGLGGLHLRHAVALGRHALHIANVEARLDRAGGIIRRASAGCGAEHCTTARADRRTHRRISCCRSDRRA